MKFSFYLLLRGRILLYNGCKVTMFIYIQQTSICIFLHNIFLLAIIASFSYRCKAIDY